MFASRSTLLPAAVLLALFGGSQPVAWPCPSAIGAEPPAKESKKTIDEKPSKEIQKLLKQLRSVNEERRDALTKELQKAPEESANFLIQLAIARQLLEVKLTLANKHDDRITAYKAYYDHTLAVTEVCKKHLEKGHLSTVDSLGVKAAHLEAEVQFLKAKNKETKGPAAEKEIRRIHQALTERRDTLLQMWKQLGDALKDGRRTPDNAMLDHVSRLVLEAELAVADKRGRLKALQTRYEQAKGTEEISKAMLEVGRTSLVEYHYSRSARLVAEVAFERAKKDGRYSPQIRKLLKDRLAALSEEFKIRELQIKAGKVPADSMLAESPRLLDAELAVAITPAEALKAYQKYRDNMAELEKIYKNRHEAERIPLADYLSTKAARVQAEIWVLEAKSKAPAPKK
jgi:hypothetical protein